MMILDVIESRGWTVIEPECRALNAQSAASFKRAVSDIVVRNGPRRLILNLRRVGYVDSAGLGTIIYVRKLLDGGDVVLAGVNEQLKGLLEITGLENIFRVAASAEEIVDD